MSNTLSHNKIIALVGPTASGKTELGIRLAKCFSGYVISADSRQIYREMNIGTGKPPLSRAKTICGHKAYTLSGIPHFMFNMVDPNTRYSVSEYQKTVYSLLECYQTKYPSSLPFLVGGTGLYIDAVLENWQIPHHSADTLLQKRLTKHTLTYLVKKLQACDPYSARRIDVLNKRRVLRALEYTLTEKKSFFQERKKGAQKFHPLILGIDLPRVELYNRINTRVDIMMEKGLLSEVKKLSKEYSWGSPAMDGIGYRQFQKYFSKKISLDEAVETLKRDTRHYAKKQLTWWRRNKNIVWIHTFTEAKNTISHFLKSS